MPFSSWLRRFGYSARSNVGVVQKLDKITDRSLENAVFGLYEYDLTTNTYVDVEGDAYPQIRTIGDPEYIYTDSLGKTYTYFGEYPDEQQNKKPGDIALEPGKAYCLVELQAPEGYVLDQTPYVFQINAWLPNQAGTIAGIRAYNNQFGFALYNIEETSVSASKTWVDTYNQDGYRPESIEVTLCTGSGNAKTPVTSIGTGSVKLYRNNELLPVEQQPEEGATKVNLTPDSNGVWSTVKWDGIPKYDNNNQLITYSVLETAVEHYDTAYSGIDTNGNIVITNTHETEKINISVTKKWEDNNDQDGLRDATPVYVALLANGSVYDLPNDNIDAYIQIGINDKEWHYQWKDLPKKANGENIVYTVAEYLKEDSGYIKVDNTNQITTDDILGYTTAIDGYTITNTHTPLKESKTVIKNWVDDDNKLKNRPSKATVKLVATTYDSVKGQFVETDISSLFDDDYVFEVDLELDGSLSKNWTYTWENLPSFINGKDITYEVVETVDAHYVASYKTSDTFTNNELVNVENGSNKKYVVITNTIKTEEVAISADKKWIDNNNYDGMRPDSITLKLQESIDNKEWTDVKDQSGEVITKTLGADKVSGMDSNLWSYVEWSNLPKYKNRTLVQYKVVEVSEIGGYEEGTSPITELDIDDIRAKLTVKNTHYASTAVSLDVQKVLTGKRKLFDGKVFKNGEFIFKLVQVTEDGEKQIATASIDTDGKARFVGRIEATENANVENAEVVIPELVYTEAGTYVYKIKEVMPVTGKVPGVTYSDAICTVTVVVAKNPTDGRLVASVSYAFDSDDNRTDNAKNTGKVVLKEGAQIPQFTNMYKATGKTEFYAMKTLNDQGIAEANPFEFTLFNGNEVEVVAENDSSGIIKVSVPEYTQDDIGTHTYTLRETSSGGKYDYDSTIYTIRVVVADNGDGTLNVTPYLVTLADDNSEVITELSEMMPTIENPALINFVNTYISEGSMQVGVKKKVISGTGKELDAPTSGQFAFTLEQYVDGKWKAISGVPSITSSTTNGGTSKFEPIRYTAKDIDETYQYRVKEVVPETPLSGYTYSTQEYFITVGINDENADGTLELDITYKEGEDGIEKTYNGDSLDFEFVNTYKATGKITFKGSKVLLGRNISANDTPEFIFELLERKNGALEEVYTYGNGAVTNAGGEFSFEEISYSEDDLGTHYYIIREYNEEGIHKGYEYDSSLIEVTVKVEEVANNRDGKLKVTAYIGNEEITTYTDVNNKSVASVDPSRIKFTNTYSAKGSISFDVQKVLNGRGLNDTNTPDFKFVLTPADEITKATEAEVTVSASRLDGIARFALSYNQDDAGKIYTYTLTETPKGTNKDGYTYSDEEYTVRVKISDNGNGTLAVQFVDEKEEVISTPVKGIAIPTFINTYYAKIDTAINVTKILENKAWSNETFTFELALKEKDGEPVAGSAVEQITVSVDDAIENVANVSIPLSYEKGYINNEVVDETGVYVYELSEVNCGKTIDGYTYSGNVYTITVTVTDSGDYELDVEQDVLLGTTPIDKEEISFTNTYNASGETSFKAIKNVQGTELKTGQFEFILYDSNRQEKDRRSNGNKGTVNEVVLGEGVLKYGLDDAGQSFRYLIVEDDTAKLPGYKYDPVVYTAVVSVTDNGAGSLLTDIQYYEGDYLDITLPLPEEMQKEASEVVFENTYNASGKLELSGTKILMGDDLEKEMFEFQIVDENGKALKGIPTAKNNAEGEFKFDAINYSLKDLNGLKTKTFTYKIIELQSDYENTADRLVYPKSTWEYEVVATVTDNGNGGLDVSHTITPLFEPTKIDRDNGYEDGKIIFINQYTPYGSFELNVNKNLIGRNQAPGEFEFKLIGSHEKTAITTSVTENNIGQAKFVLEYGKEDINQYYAYTVYEVVKGQHGITYDDILYTVNVFVEDDKAGNLIPHVTIHSSESSDKISGNVLTFENTYSAEGELDLVAYKSVVGSELNSNNPFAFVLYEVDEKGNETLKQRKTNDENGDVYFETITYNKPGEYNYKLYEVNAGSMINGYTYDSTIYTIHVVVVDEDGNGKLNVTETITRPNRNGTGLEKVETIEFVNSYSSSASVPVKAIKSLNGIKPEAGTFAFTLVGLGDAPGQDQTVRNDANGEVIFDDLEFTQEHAGKTYTYLLEEVNEGKNGYTYDTSKYYVEVSVTDDGKGHLTAEDRVYTFVGTGLTQVEVTIPKKVPLFANTYDATGRVPLSVEKNLTGHALAENQFTFYLTNSLTVSEETILQTKYNDAFGQVVFDDLEYTLADVGKTFTYYISEVDNALGGYVYDKSVYKVEVTVSDDVVDGVLECPAVITKIKDTEGKDISNPAPLDVDVLPDFNNTYDAEGEIVLKASKEVEGRNIVAGRFSFELKASNGTVLQTKTNDASGNVEFAPIEYSLSDIGKTYTYTINEVTSFKHAGYTYDETSYEVKVTVADNHDGTLEASIVEIKNLVTNEKVETIEVENVKDVVVFKNRYHLEDSITLEAMKTLTGRDIENGQFLFKLEVLDKDKGDTNTDQTVTNNAGGRVKFAELSYTEADAGKIYNYKIKEYIASPVNGYVYDATEYVVSVEITDDEENGDLVVVIKDIVKITKDAEGNETTENVGPSYPMAFINTYTATGEFVVEASKIYNGGRTLTDDKFTFVLKATGDTPKVNEVNELTAETDVEGNIKFAAISYDQDDAGETYTYEVKEVVPEKDGNGYTYDRTVYTVSVYIQDNGDGTLRPVPSYSYEYTVDNGDGTTTTKKATPETITFTNKYEATGTITFSAEKHLSGRPVKDGQFAFKLSGTDIEEQIKSNVGKDVTFDTITYDMDDVGEEIAYMIEEVIPNDVPEYYTYDSAKYEVKVTVTDLGNGKLDVAKVVTRIVETTEGTATKVLGENDPIAFNNTYKATGEFTLSGKKILNGTDLADSQFTFELKDSVGTVLQTVTNDADGNIVFAPVEYDQDDVRMLPYSYTVSEVNAGADGYTYDGLVYTVSVSVTDPDGNGKLKVVPTVFKKEAALDEEGNQIGINIVTVGKDELTFINDYNATGELVVKATKTLEGRILAQNQFSFELKDSTGTVLQTKQNAVDGSVVFDALQYSEEDAGKTYTYTVNEVLVDADGYTYDETVYTVTAEIVDNGDGTLTVNDTYSYDKDVEAEDETVTTKTIPVEEIVFNNIYETEGEVVITATKSLAGRAIADGQFEFALSDEAGNVIETKVNEGNSVVFNTITYDESNVGQTFVYFVNEVIPEEKAPGYTYDETTYKVTVKVADDEVDGELEITKEITKLVEAEDNTVSEETVEVIEFNNIYKASGKLDLAAAKELIGRTLEKDQFTFVLESSGLRTPAVKQTKTNAADGTVTFDSIEFNESHVSDLPYSYRVYEVKDGKPGYTYDDVVYTVSVKVTDNGDGTLDVTPTFFKPEKVSGEGLNLGIAINPVEAITFTNTYKAEGSIVLDAEKVFAEGVQAKVEDGRFTFEISEKDGFTATAANVGNKVTFPEIKYVHDLADNSQPTVPALGEHTYTIKEINDSATNKDNTTVFFDETEYTVKVMVTDNGDGTLKAEVTSIAVGTETKEAVKFVNDVTRLNITKVDITNDKELPGATLELKDAEGNVIESWTSDDKTHYIEDVLEIGKVYTLTETVAPEGYTYVTDFTFTIDAEGNVVTEGRKTVDEKGLTTILVEDAPIKATISKVDIVDESKELVGASMQIMNAEGKEIVKTIYGEELKWVSAEEPKEITGLPAGKYILRETAAPDGYTIAEDIEFTVSADMTIENKVVMKNVAIRLEITKTGFTKDNKVVPLKGAMLEIRETKEDGGIGDIAFNVYGEKMRFESAEEAIALNGVKPGKYWLVETDAPDGYVIAEPIQITINEDMTVSQNPVKAIMEDCPIEVEVSKVDITTGEELPGATLQILTVKEDGTAGEIATTIYYVDDETTPEDKLEWVSGDTPRVIKGLAEGNYILREITAPAGYTVAVDVPFTVDSDLNVVNKVVMEDAPTEIVVSKTSLTGLAELEGAHLEIQDEEGNVVTTVYGEELSWVSGTVAKQIKGLPAGNYTLVETQSPDGYAYADDVEFTVTDEVGVVKVSMKDDTTKVEISKYDVTNEKELAGAHLILKDSEGTIVADWISNGTPKVLEGELIAGEEYILSEVSAPAGYAIAKDITFTVNMDGTLQKVVMEDEVAEGKGEIVVQKIVMQEGKYIAVDYTFYTALFADEDCTERVTSVKPLYVSGSYTTSTIFTNLPYGTYYVAETDEFGNLMEEDSIIESIQVIDGKAELLPSQATAKSTIINHVAGFDDHFYKSGEIVVNKSVVNADGEEVLVDDTFYFALFTDAALTNMADAGIVELKLSNASEGVVIFSDLPLGIYYLAETDEDGVPVGSAFEYTVTVDSSYCKLDEENPSVERTIVNQTEEEPPAGTPTPTPTPPGYNPPGGNPPGDNPPTSVPPVKTGDDTPVLPFAAGASASLLAAIWAAVLVLKRRRRNG